MPRYRSPKGYVALDLESDGTFTLWVLDESKPFMKTWIFYEGNVSSAPDRLVLSSTTKTLWAENDTDPDTSEFVVTLVAGVPSEVAVFGDTLALAPGR